DYYCQSYDSRLYAVLF
nr:immunoglobulin light chain junction region [Macaca mulatta]